MPIIAESTPSFERELVPSGSHLARCYSMIEIGTVETVWQGEKKNAKKVRLTFELPNELRVFKPENGEQPMVISREFTLSMHENAGLRKFLKSWRGKDFTEEEAMKFDVTNLLGVPALITVTHREDQGKTYADLSSASPIVRGMTCPEQVNKTVLLSYDSFDFDIYNALPKFLQDKIANTPEYGKIQAELTAKHNANRSASAGEPSPMRDVSDEPQVDELPF